MLETGDRVGRYRIESKLGAGGMGEVYRAYDTQLARSVALKRLLPGEEKDRPTWVARMLREARAAAAFNHANAVAIYDVGEHDGLPFLVMELVEGKSLRAFVNASEPGWRTRVRWMIDAARALGAAHAAGLVHRDVKPDNVMVRAADGAVKVLDFGIARSARESAAVDTGADTKAPSLGTITQAGVSIGTPAYMSPEQMQTETIDGRSDQFAWGVMLFELLAGKLPWGDADEGLKLVAAILTRPTDSLANHRVGMPPELDAVIKRATAKRAEERFPSMDAAIAALTPIVEGAAKPTDADVVSAPTVAVDEAMMKAAISSGVAVSRTAGQTAPGGGSMEGARRSSGALLAGAAIAALCIAGGFMLSRHTPPAIAPAASASIISAPAPAPIATDAPPLRALCGKDVKDDCTEGTRAWCDTDNHVLACCAPDLAATGKDGMCDCAPGGYSGDAKSACPKTTDHGVGDAEGVIAALRPAMRACYNKGLETNQSLEGAMLVEVHVDPEGVVYRARIKDGQMASAVVQKCVLEELRRARFKPPADGDAELDVPIHYKQTHDDAGPSADKKSDAPAPPGRPASPK